ncbi:MAG: ATP-binding protein, partial [Spirochaetes bacterium]|nr:ATP-binding protein [Spirochaetota bacterium]
GFIIVTFLSMLNIDFPVEVTGIPYLFFISIIAFSLLSNMNKEHYDLLDLKVSLEERIKERTQELQNAKKNLEEESQQRIDFFINFSHEIKTPLTLIINFLEKHIKKKGLDDDLKNVREYLAKMRSDIMNLLDCEKLLRNHTDDYQHEIYTDLSQLLNKQIIFFKENAKSKKIKLTDDICQGIVIQADPYVLERITNNLLDNAVKYTNENGQLKVQLMEKDDKIALIIRDNGIGIPADQMETIFQPYYQISHKKRNYQGMGMGLFMVKLLMDSIQDSHIFIESIVNKGTTFTLQFEKPTDQIQETIENTFDLLYFNPSLKNPAIEIPEEPVIKADKKNILLVDDNIELINLVYTELKDQYNFFYALNGIDALTKLEKYPEPDIIISDIMMDHMDGYEFYQRLIQENQFDDIPFIFLTAKSDFDCHLQSLEQGVIDFVVKPFYMEILKAKIESHLIIRDKYKQKIKKRIIKAVDEDDSSNKISKNLIHMLCHQYNLTERETEIAYQIITSKSSNQEIADKLFISIKTLEKHLTIIYKKFNIQNKVELLQLFMT